MAKVVSNATDWVSTPLSRGVVYITIPPYDGLTDEERAAVDAGGQYPVIVEDYQAGHLALVDFLIERSLEAWARSKD